MQSPKIVVIGAGSHFFGRPVIWNMVNSEILKGGTLALVDTDPDTLNTLMDLARKAVDAAGTPTVVTGSTDRREVLQDADFVVLTFSEHNTHYRCMDAEVSFKHGVRMCSADTIGPGGIFRSLREIPRALEMAEDIRELAPDAWTINFVNPTAVLGIALRRYAPEIRSFAICDSHHEPYYRLKTLKKLGILPEDATEIPTEIERKLDLHVMGVNHFTWITKLNYDGKDYLPEWYQKLLQEAEESLQSKEIGGPDIAPDSKGKFNPVYAQQLMEMFGAYPDIISHTKEYVPFFQGCGTEDIYPEPIRVFDGHHRAQLMAEKWNETQQFARGEKSIGEFLSSGQPDHATDIIEAVWGNLRKPFYINTLNSGAVPNMADDAFLELRCDVDINGPRPQPLDPMPRGLLGLQQNVLDTHELTAEAAVSCDRHTLLRAMMTDPIIHNYEDAKNIMNELLERQSDILPTEWYE